MNYSPEQQRAAYENLPRPVRSYLASTKLYDLIQALGQKYGLHIDTVGAVAQVATTMILGLMNPIQFQTELVHLGIPDATTDLIIQDLNEKVFKPLRDEMRNALPEEGSETTPAPSVSIQISTPPPPAYNPPSATQPRPVPPPPRIVVTPPVQRPAPMPQAAPVPQAPRPVPAPPPAASQTFIPPSAPQPVWPNPQPIPVPRPVPIPRPVSTPIPSQNPAPQQNVPRPASSNREELHNILKQYGVDPYREPPE